ncbi:MAG: DUF1501 domain-containing protein [Planctomycetes bacterium]|nr:DUF1501 domain-containing protein [Planctomycetota bacterium]
MFGNPLLSRRAMLKASSCGFGYMALAGLASQEAAASPPASRDPMAPRAPHFTPRAKRVIFMCMRGGPTHVDTFDYKPGLARREGQTVSGVPGGNGRRLKPSPWEFPQCGQSGLPISSLFPHLARHADDLCLLNSMQTSVPNHPQAFLMLHTGEFRFTRPSMGSWILYGLGTENQSLPGFITISPPPTLGGAQNYGNAFLPAAFQATRIGQQGTAVAQARVGNLTSPLGASLQRRQLDLLQSMNNELLQQQQINQEIEGVINSYELGFRMQTALPELMDLSRESQRTLDMYGVDNGPTSDFGRQCLMARRFASAGVRFIEVCHNANWDTHNGLSTRVPQMCRQIDQPMAALLTDLKQHGMLEDTLVLWGGEFGRTPHVRNNDGRDHNATGFSMWAAGGGVKGGIRYGATDETGITAVENPMHHHDLHATVLHLLGLDHQRLTFRYGGRDYSLTDIHGNIARGILA